MAYRYFRILNRELIHLILTGNPVLERAYYHDSIPDEALDVRFDLETELLEASFESDTRDWIDISLDEEFMERLAPYEVTERYVDYATA